MSEAINRLKWSVTYGITIDFAPKECGEVLSEIARLTAALLFCDELSRGDEGRINCLVSALGLYDTPNLLTDERRNEFMALMDGDLDGEP